MEKKETIEYHETIKNKKEMEALDKFRINLKKIIDKKDKPYFSNPSILLDSDSLIHFLRATNLNIKTSTKMILDCFQWREKVNLDNIYLNYELKDKYRALVFVPQGFHKTAKDGNPIYLMAMGHCYYNEFFKIYTPEEILTYIIKIGEIVTRDYFKICSQIKEKYVFGVVIINDFKGINKSLLNKKMIEFATSILKLGNHYPLIGARLIAINTGLLFRTFYTAIKYLINSELRKVIKIYGEKYQQGLLEIIDKENLPKFYGGTCECPEGCFFSNAGPWKKQVEIEEKIPEDILKRRKEINDIMTFGKLQTSPEDKIENIGKEGIDGDGL